MTLEEQLDEVIDGKEVSVELPRVPVWEVIKYMRSLGFTEDQETNGYCVDFWIHFTKESSPSFTFMGDLWYNETYTFASEDF